MADSRPIAAVFDTKSYDRDYLSRETGSASVDLRFHEFRLEAETAAAAEGASVVCVFVNDKATPAVLQQLAKYGVRHLALRCAGYNNVSLKGAEDAGIVVTRVPAYSPYAVAEHTIALLLAVNRKLYRAYNRVREFNFSIGGLVGFDLRGKTLGIVGTGRTGKLVAQMLKSFQMKVLAYDVHPDVEWAEKHDIKYADFLTLVQESDILSLHAPLTPETDHLINKATIAKMKRGVVIVNVSRGRLIHTKALIHGLKSGHIGGVALDVYEEEEGVFFEDLSGEVLQDDDLARLLTFPNVLITAHQAFLTHEALSEIARVTFENVNRILEGRPPLEGTVLKAPSS